MPLLSEGGSPKWGFKVIQNRNLKDEKSDYGGNESMNDGALAPS